MSVHCLAGKPGGGKTLYAMRLIGDELLVGNRVIVTNVPVNIAELAKWVEVRRPGLNIMERVFLLDDTHQTGQFWRFRPGGSPLPFVGKDNWQNLHDREQLSKAYAEALPRGGVMFVIDEVHNFFAARDWSKTGPDVLYYLSQHRRFGDTVILISQSMNFVESQFRALAQDLTVLTNIGKSKALGFRMPRLFFRSLYNGSKEATIALERKVTVLDSSLAACYNTAAGVGIHGRSADIGERLTGAPWWAGLAIVGLVTFCLFNFVPRMVANYFSGSTNAILKPVNGSHVAVSTNVPVSPMVSVVAAAPAAPVVVTTNRMTGCMLLNGFLHVTMADGSIRRMKVDSSGPGWVVVNGRLLVLPP
jgi:hypothetical protein